MSRLVFVTGGARSGKSSFAERLAEADPRDVTYLATAQAFDEEMTDRIRRHREGRHDSWHTIEQPHDIDLQACKTPVVLLDCLSLWVSNLMLNDQSDDRILEACDQLLCGARARGGLFIFVSNEVGSGIVPDNALARRYRDVLGWVNARVAAEADEAYLCVSGLSVRLKGEGI